MAAHRTESSYLQAVSERVIIFDGAMGTNLQMAGLTASKISRADVAAFLLRQVASDEFVGKAPVITD